MNGAPPGMEFPTLRRLDIRPHRLAGTDGLLLSDPMGIAQTAFVPRELLPILRSFDGSADCQTIAKELQASGIAVEVETVSRVARELGERLLLESREVEAATDTLLRNFLTGGARPTRHAGSAGYPLDVAELQQTLLQLSPRETVPVFPTPRGLVAPHIDLARGAPGYRAAYERLAMSRPAELYVVLGTGHGGPMAPVTGLGLDWETPIGRLPTDRAFIEAVHQQVGAPDPQDVLLHRDEHSLEFQMLLLRHVHKNQDIAVAGFLTGHLPSAAGDPTREAYVQRLLQAFRAAAASSGKRVCFVAGADLAHVGPDFGDPELVDAARALRLETDERQRLGYLTKGSPGAFHHSVVAGGNPDRVCSASALFLVGSLAGGPAELLHYGQAIDGSGRQVVGFAAAVYDGTPSAGG